MKNKIDLLNQIKIFGMQNLMLEADLAKLEKKGFEIGHIRTTKTDAIVDIDLFDFEIRKQARKMADFYVLYYCLENTIRELIDDVLSEKYGSNWWNDKVPEGVRNHVKEKQDKEKQSVLSIRSDDPLTYTDFGELIDIFNSNWSDFSDVVRSQKAMQQTLFQFGQLRNVIAHSCELCDDDISRFELLIKDWQRIQM